MRLFLVRHDNIGDGFNNRTARREHAHWTPLVIAGMALFLVNQVPSLFAERKQHSRHGRARLIGNDVSRPTSSSS